MGCGVTNAVPDKRGEGVVDHRRTLDAVRVLAGVLASDRDPVAQFRLFTTLLRDLIDVKAVGLWLFQPGRGLVAAEDFLLGTSPRHRDPAFAIDRGIDSSAQSRIAAHSLEVPWEASGQVLGLIAALGSRRRRGFDAEDDWVLRVAGELAGTVLIRRWTALENDPQVGLSRREVIVASLVARGYTNSRIAGELNIGRATVASHVAHILSKLGYRSRAQIAGWVAREESKEPSWD